MAKRKEDFLLPNLEEQKVKNTAKTKRTRTKKNTSAEEKEIKGKIQINKDLESLIPPLTNEEFDKLEASILEEGCRDPLVLWKDREEYVLVDGHNRLKICQRHGKEFKIVLKEFEGIEYVKDWMINNQLGKRNVTEAAKSYLRGIQYTNEKLGHGGNKKSSGQSDHLKTHERLAKQHKVSPKTIQRDEQYSEAVNKVTKDDDQLRWKILNKDIDIPKKDLIELGELPDTDIKKIVNDTIKIGWDEARSKWKGENKKEVKEKKTKSPTGNKLKDLKDSIIKEIRGFSGDRKTLEEIQKLISQLDRFVEDKK